MAQEKIKKKDYLKAPLKADRNPPSQIQPDGGWGWVVCFTSMCANGTVFGSINTFGILYVTMVASYAGDDPNIGFKTSWVGSVCIGLTFLMCMVASILTDRIGIRKVSFCGGLLAFIGMLSSAFVNQIMLYYLTYGILMGIGFALSYSPSLVILGHYFKKRMGLVNGLVTFGSAVFTITYSLVLPELLKTIGLQYTFLCLSGMIFLLMPYSLTWKPLIHRETNLAALALSTESVVEHLNDCCLWTRKFLNVKIWRNRGYVVWAVATGVCLFGYFIPFVHLVKHTNDVFPGSNGNLLPMCISITSGVSRISFGLLADINCVSRVHMQQAAFFLLGVTTMCIPFADSFTSLIIICLVMGLCDGLFICLVGPIAFDLVGEQGASQALGFLFGIFSVPMTAGPPVAGFLYDYLGSYRVAFHVAGAPPIIGSLIMFLIPRHQERVPAVTQIEEFIGVSCPDIYSSRIAGSANDQVKPASPATVENGGPSRTEMIVVSDPDLYNRLQAEGFVVNGAGDVTLPDDADDEIDEEKVRFLTKAKYEDGAAKKKVQLRMIKSRHEDHTKAGENEKHVDVENDDVSDEKRKEAETRKEVDGHVQGTSVENSRAPLNIA